MFPVNSESLLQFEQEGYFVRYFFGNLYFVREHAPEYDGNGDNRDYAYCDCIGFGNLVLRCHEGKGDEETEEHGQKSHDTRYGDGGDGVGGVPEFTSEGYGLDCVAPESAREQVVEEVAEGDIGVKCAKFDLFALV